MGQSLKRIFFTGNGLTSDFKKSNWWVPVDYEDWGMAVDFSNAMP